jgi:hypothetical protein
MRSRPRASGVGFDTAFADIDDGLRAGTVMELKRSPD